MHHQPKAKDQLVLVSAAAASPKAWRALWATGFRGTAHLSLGAPVEALGGARCNMVARSRN
jgi:hypothetical protein